MTLLTKFMLINLTEIIFETLLRKKYFRRITKFLPTTSFWPQNDPNLTIFTKNDLFDQIDTINDTFD